MNKYFAEMAPAEVKKKIKTAAAKRNWLQDAPCLPLWWPWAMGHEITVTCELFCVAAELSRY